MFVILQRKPRPVRIPVSAHHHEDAGLFSSASQSVQSDAAQKKMDGASMVISSAPALKIGETQISTTARQGASAAGQNNRSNNIQVDGATISDAFGLATTGGGTGAPTESAEPISLDAIDQFRVNIAPFDVRESNFAGASINAITRSGDNTFHGSVYGVGRNEDRDHRAGTVSKRSRPTSCKVAKSCTS